MYKHFEDQDNHYLLLEYLNYDLHNYFLKQNKKMEEE